MYEYLSMQTKYLCIQTFENQAKEIYELHGLDFSQSRRSLLDTMIIRKIRWLSRLKACGETPSQHCKSCFVFVLMHLCRKKKWPKAGDMITTSQVIQGQGLFTVLCCSLKGFKLSSYSDMHCQFINIRFHLYFWMYKLQSILFFLALITVHNSDNFIIQVEAVKKEWGQIWIKFRSSRTQFWILSIINLLVFLS